MSKPLFGVLQAVLLAGLLHAAVTALRPSRPAGPAPLVDEQAGRIREIAIHYAPGSTFADRTWIEFFRQLPADVTVWAAVEKPEHAEELARLTGRRVRPVPVGLPITTWARDRFVIAADGALVVPPEPQPGAIERRNDWHAPFALAKRLGVAVRVAPFRFDGGDFCRFDGKIFATRAWAERNPERTPSDLVALARDLFGEDVVYLPVAPRHHVGMVFAPAGKGRFVVGDVRLGASLAPADASIDAALAEEFDAVAEALAARGYEVVRIPVAPTTKPYAWMTFTNAIFENRVVYMPTYGHGPFDDAAAETYAKLGFEVKRVDVSSVWTNGGTLHCLVHVLRRS